MPKSRLESMSFLSACAMAIAYAAGADAATASAQPAREQWSFHFQATTVTQVKPGFDSPYAGPNSMSGAFESRTSLTSTLFLGRRLWPTGEIYLNPEITGGSGLSGTHGIAGFPNGEAYRVGSLTPKLTLARLFLRQTVPLGDDTEKIEADINQLAGTAPRSRLVIHAGEFSLSDFFDDNSYSHDPRTQFLNWALMDNGAWDYAANTRGYTVGIDVELHLPRWTLRLAEALEPKEANQTDWDLNVLQAHSSNAELEYRYGIHGHPGAVRLLAYLNRANMGNYRRAIEEAPPPMAPDITLSRSYSVKYGFGLDAEQEIAAHIGAFVRLGWNNGATETWAFTEIDRTVNGGLSVGGDLWSRPGDTAGVAMVWNGLSRVHADYLSNGGLGFILGDGGLSYAPEEILETYYLYKIVRTLEVTGDFQFVDHPGYNRDRGPVAIFSARLHYEF